MSISINNLSFNNSSTKFYKFNNINTNNIFNKRKIDVIHSNNIKYLLLTVLLLQLNSGIYRSYKNNVKRTFNFNSRYTNFKPENTYKPRTENTYKPRTENTYKPSAENTYKPSADSNYNVYTNKNINAEATDALNTLGLTNKDINKLTLKEINKEYRKNALKYHPDKNKGLEATEKFNKMTEARDFLLAYTKKNQ